MMEGQSVLILGVLICVCGVVAAMIVWARLQRYRAEIHHRSSYQELCHQAVTSQHELCDRIEELNGRVIAIQHLLEDVEEDRAGVMSGPQVTGAMDR